MQTNRSRFAFQRPSADLARSHLTALRYSRARIVAPETLMPRQDSSHSLKLHREAADAVRIMAAADSCQEAKGRAVQYARFACALKQEARKLERQAEQFLEDAAAERKKQKVIQPDVLRWRGNRVAQVEDDERRVCKEVQAPE